jgi:hypothetical protein
MYLQLTFHLSKQILVVLLLWLCSEENKYAPSNLKESLYLESHFIYQYVYNFV